LAEARGGGPRLFALAMQAAKPASAASPRAGPKPTTNSQEDTEMSTVTTPHTTEGRFDRSRYMANDALERAGDSVREFGTGMKGMAHKGMQSASERAHAAQRYLSEYTHATGRYVADQPLKSALIAAAVGAALAGLVLVLRRSRQYDDYRY
jgi:ElaB/YqjD/DUF883 family membrane-anchored ribosome-binding protein